MPYVERVTKAGNTIEIERYFTSRYNKRRAGESKHQTGREKVKDTHKCKLWLWGLPFSA